MTKNVMLKILSVAIATVVTVVILEGVVRLLGLAPTISTEFTAYSSSQYLAYGPAPNSHVTGRSAAGEFAFDYRHNSFGFRDDERTLEKPEGVFRILGLGDSFTYGTGAEFRETYLSLLEQMLNARPGRHPRVEIIRAGVSRFFPEPERMLLESLGRKLTPDLVIVGFIPNDVIDTYLGLDAVTVDRSGFFITREAKELGSIGIFLYRKSHLCRMILSKYVSWRMRRNYRPNWADIYKEDGYHEADWRKIEEEYRKMSSITREMGAKLLVLHIPQKGPWDERASYPPRRLDKWARANGVAFVDSLPAMKESRSAGSLYFPVDGHCTPAGYAIVANELAKYLTAERLVP